MMADEMAGYQVIERAISKALELVRRPIAISFRDAAPSGIAKFAGTEPSGCSFWRIAAEGKTFYTVPSDHFNCAVGSHTHNIELPKDRAGELEQTITFMSKIQYIRMEEITGFARLAKTPGVVVYAPLGDTPVDPDVVLFVGRPARISLLMEAASRAGISAKAPFLGRPTCSALAATLAEGAVVSTGCIGNRVYTDLGEDELYAAIRGSDVTGLADEAQTIAAANLELADYYRARRKNLATQ
jgi:uncharacterized protein (DUF169 family)